MTYSLRPMSAVQTAPSPAPDSLQAFCRAVLERGDLAGKLQTPRSPSGAPLPDRPEGFAHGPARPARDPGLQMGPGGGNLPPARSLGDPEARKRCLARFAHHELQAVEYFAWALLRWPDAPAGLRRGLVAALIDEQRHCRLYLDRLAELGGRFDTDDHSDYFWQQAPAIAESPAGLRAFLAGMGLTLEQANLDFTLTYRDAFRAAGDEASAEICQVVHDDEIAHVALAARWLARLDAAETHVRAEHDGADSAPTPTDTGTPETEADDDLRAYLAAVPFPLGPARAKGRRFDVAARRRAGLSDALIEHVRAARTQEKIGGEPLVLIANLGAEEGERGQGPLPPPARTAAALWRWLFPRRAQLVDLDAAGEATATTPGWPSDLGNEPSQAALPFLDEAIEEAGAPQVWLHTEAVAAQLAAQDASADAPAPEIVARCHDKAFAAEAARALDLEPKPLRPLVEVLSPEACSDGPALRARLAATLEAWPEWTGRRFTLKPRQGTSGRGRVGGTGDLSDPRFDRGLDRLAARGGALFEPWLDRTGDFSVTLHVPRPAEGDGEDGEAAPLVVLGSLELWVAPNGTYRGHAGEIDARGRVFSGDREDETLRAEAAAVATRARDLGFFGPCGVDAFRYREPGSTPDDPGRERLRPAVEFNARATMGLVAIGLVKRALPRVRKRLGLSPGDRHGFALTYRPADDRDWRERVYRHVGNEAVIVDLGPASAETDPRASLVFARDPEAIRAARIDAFRC